MGEFDLIELVARLVPCEDPSLLLGIGDDAAVIDIPAGNRLLVSTDTLNLGHHFSATTEPINIGRKALAVNLSDMAAMGAKPRWVTLNLSLPQIDTDWLRSFLEGFAEQAAAHGVVLVGGDTTRGPLSISVTVMGCTAGNDYLQRGTARSGDLIVVSGFPGLAAYALDCLGKEVPVNSSALNALEQPEPRVNLGQQLIGLATACIDISDGLLADLGHICQASGLGAVLELGDLPVPGELADLPVAERWNFQLAGGDDYELCFTIPADRGSELSRIEKASGVQLSIIGRLHAGNDVSCVQADGRPFDMTKPGFDHFDGRE